MKIKVHLMAIGVFLTAGLQLFGQSNLTQNRMLKFKNQTPAVQHINATMGAMAQTTDTVPVGLLENIWDTTNSVWTQDAKANLIYNSNRALEKEEVLEWNDSANEFLPLGEIVITYNTDGKVAQEITLYWDNATSAYDMNSNQNTYTYDSANNQVTEITQEWIDSTSAWVNNDKYIITYNASNFPIQEINQYWQTNAWVNSNKDTYVYDSKGKQSSETDYNWSSGSWVNGSLTTDYRDPVTDSLTSYIYQYWNGSAYVNSSKDLYSYSSSTGQLQGLIYQYWDATTTSWINSQNTNYQYDNTYKNKIGTVITQNWSAYHNGWVNSDELIYTYQALSLSGISPKNTAALQLNTYPNPATNNIVFDYTLTGNSTTVLSIYSTDGKLLRQINNGMEETGNHTLTISLKDGNGSLSSGMYFYKLQAGNNVANGKLIVQ